MILKNKQVMFAKAILEPLQLDIQKSSARRKFLRDLKDFVEDIKETQKEIQEKFADKDDKGEIKLVNGMIKYSGESKKKSEKEWDKLHEEEVKLVVDESNARDVATIITVLKEKLEEFEKEKENNFSSDEFEYHEELVALIETLTNKTYSLNHITGEASSPQPIQETSELPI